jgi:hypothetical protein
MILTTLGKNHKINKVILKEWELKQLKHDGSIETLRFEIIIDASLERFG